MRSLQCFWAIFALVVVALSGCPEFAPEVALLASTAPPPSRTARIDHRDVAEGPSTLTISNGVVMRLGCWDSCDYTCEQPVITSADPGIVQVRPTYGLAGSSIGYVLVATAPGSTRLTVATDCAEHEYAVTVVDE